MKYYKLGMDMDRPNDIICHYENDFGLRLYDFCIAEKYQGWDGRFSFFYDKTEGKIATDYLANDKGWFVVSEKLKNLMETLQTEIQYLPVKVVEKHSGEQPCNYYIANILTLVDALCLEESDYFSTEIDGLGTIYTVSRYGIYEEKTQGADVFKLANRQEIPIFVSERFKDAMEAQGITGIELMEIAVV